MEGSSDLSSLTLFCAAPFDAAEPFRVSLFDHQDTLLFTEEIPANRYVSFPLPGGAYRICVRSAAALDPGGITKWLDLPAGQRRMLYLLFRPEDGCVPVVRLRITLVDLHYPHILPINGGITVWQQPTTP